MANGNPDGWRETRVDSWQELLEALHRPGMIPKDPTAGDHLRSPYVFRGMSSAGWRLQTSLERLGTRPADVEDVEAGLLRSFRKYAPRGAFAEHSDWEALSVGQHNGLPTRVLDWSVSPLIAAHFATSEREHFDKDGVIWCVHVLGIRDRAMPQALSELLRKPAAAVYDVRLLTRKFPSLEELDKLPGQVCVFYEPPSIEARIASQFGILSAMNGPAISHHDFFRQVAAQHPDLVHRVVIASGAKSQIRDMLDQNNINERMLFPGMPGLCDWLRRYYGPA